MAVANLAEQMMSEKFGGTVAGPLDVRVWLRMLSCTMTIEKRLRRNLIEQYDTTLPCFDVMAALDRYPDGLTMGDLSKALLVSNGNVTAVVKQLQAKGWATSTPDEKDRRSFIVALSSAGRKQFSRLAPAHHQWIHEAFAGFPLEQQAVMLDLLASLKSSISKA
jgi:DNA-binding MarR family transcriptional regulator